MVRYREILRLTAKGLSQRTVADSVGCARSTVSVVLARCSAAGVEWPLPDEMDDAAIRARIYPSGHAADAGRAPIDHDRVERELGRRGITMTLLWSEYCGLATLFGTVFSETEACLPELDRAHVAQGRVHSLVVVPPDVVV